MNELRLLFSHSQDGGYTVRIDNNWSGSPSEPIAFTPFLTDDDFEDLRWYLEDFLDLPDGGSVVRARRIEANLAEWGRRFYDALFKDGDHRELLNHLQRQGAPRLLTIATRDPSILRLPWELMADSRGPLVRQGITIRRQLETARTPIEFQTTLPLRVLYVVSRPGDLGFVDPPLSTRSMLDALAPLGADVRVDFCRPPTLARLEDMLREARRAQEPYHIVHFDGHGTFLPDIELGALCFEKPDDATVLADAKTDYVRADRLGDLLAAYDIPLVILEACRTGTIGKVAVFRAVAPRLIEAGVGSVISMSHAVHVEAARVLLERFYRELVTGVTVGQALEQGRAALIANPHRWIEYGPGGRTVELKDWHLPHLYERGRGVSLVPPGRSLSSPSVQPDQAKPFDVFLSHQHADSARVERLALQLKTRHGLRVRLDKWECGPGPLHDQCVRGVAQSRFVLLAVSRSALSSSWVAAEQDWARAGDPQGWHVVPLLFEDVPLPPDLQALHWQDFRDPTKDAESTAKLAGLIPVASRSIAAGRAAGGRVRLATRDREHVGAFPPAPVYGFHGRAHELYEIERRLRSHRAVLLHAMGGMGKTELASEAAHWWTRTGLFPDGACFLSFEQPASAERVIQVLGAYLDGNDFNARPAADQRRRAKELFQDKRVLMVWDNFESVLPAFQSGQGAGLYADDERSRLLDLFSDWTGSPDGQGRLLVTCRPEDAGLPGACKHELRGLARPDSLWLLVRVLETAGVNLDDPRLGRDRLNRLIDMLADHPLSIELVGPHLKHLTPEQIIADFGRLLAEFTRGAGVDRNESLLVSLAFSTRRLSDAAQAALPWLGLFSAGVFEDNLLDVSGLEPQQWEAVRAEVEATALVRVERDLQMNQRPYLRFHPTLAYAVSGLPLTPARSLEDGGESDRRPGREVRARFVRVYVAVMRAVDRAMGGSNPRGGIDVLAREEANFRTAVRWAVEDREYAVASALGDTYRKYLERSGRLRERDAWVTWLVSEVRRGGFSQAVAERERDEAWTLLTQGQGEEAIRGLEALLQRLSATTEFDPAFELTATQSMLGRVLHASGLSERAIPVLEDAVAQWEALVTRAEAGQVDAARGNLSTALDDLANALRSAGRLDEALAAAERGLDIDRARGADHQVAAGLGQTAQILVLQGRYAEADARYDAAIAAARRSGDKALEGAVIQHQGSLADDLDQYDRAASLYQRALKLFQEMNDEGAMMRTCNLLGVVERAQGRLTEARTWYERSREIARRLGAVRSLAGAAQNISIVCQEEGEAARQQGREPQARQRFEEAKRSLQESLRGFQKLEDKPNEARSRYHLTLVHLLLGELDQAERHALQSLQIDEELALTRELPADYNIVAGIARSRGDAAQAAEWERKRDAAREELERRGRGPGGLAPQFLQAVQALSMACARAAVEGAQLGPAEESALAQIEKWPAPLPELTRFLRRLAGGEIPEVPAGLPAELGEFLDQLLDAIKESRRS